jgi:hypothetical protein
MRNRSNNGSISRARVNAYGDAVLNRALDYADGYCYGRDGGTYGRDTVINAGLEGNAWYSGYLRGRADYVRSGYVQSAQAVQLRALRTAGIGAGLHRMLPGS